MQRVLECNLRGDPGLLQEMWHILNSIIYYKGSDILNLVCLGLLQGMWQFKCSLFRPATRDETYFKLSLLQGIWDIFLRPEQFIAVQRST